MSSKTDQLKRDLVTPLTGIEPAHARRGLQFSLNPIPAKWSDKYQLDGEGSAKENTNPLHPRFTATIISWRTVSLS
jgi:hypothetical protein